MKGSGAQDGTAEVWREARRSKILAAATELFAGRSFAQVQMDEVARLAGMGKPTLYRYFPSKAELFVAAFEGLLDGLEARLQEIRRSNRPARQQMADMIEAMVSVLADQVATLPYLEGESPDLAGRWRVVYRRRRQSVLRHLQLVLEAGQAAGEFRQVDTQVVPSLIMGMVRGGLVGASAEPGTDITGSVAAAAQRLVLDGLLTD